MQSVPVLIVLFATGRLSTPMPAPSPADDEPIRVDLPVYEQPQASSDILLAEPLQPENHAAVQISNDQLTNGNFISQKIKEATNVIGNTLGSGKAGLVPAGFGVFSAPVVTREGAILETEGWGSKTLSVKENIQNIVAGLFQPKPIVDTIREEDKYGNTGDKFSGVGRAAVAGAEGASNLVNTVLEVPANIVKKITRAASEKLNNLGGRLIGLN